MRLPCMWTWVSQSVSQCFQCPSVKKKTKNKNNDGKVKCNKHSRCLGDWTAKPRDAERTNEPTNPRTHDGDERWPDAYAHPLHLGWHFLKKNNIDFYEKVYWKKKRRENSIDHVMICLFNGRRWNKIHYSLIRLSSTPKRNLRQCDNFSVLHRSTPSHSEPSYDGHLGDSLFSLKGWTSW